MMKTVLGVAAMAAAGAMTCAAQAATIDVSTNAQLVAAAKAAKGGDIIRVKPGNYGDLVLKDVNPASGVSIVAYNSTRPPVFTNIIVRESSNLRLTRLTVNSPAPEPGVTSLSATNIWNSSDIRMRGMVITGVPGGGLANEANGLRIRDSRGVQVADSRFLELRNGIVADGSSHMAISDNRFDRIRINGILSNSASASTIARNRIASFYPEEGDHPDAIQIFTSGVRTSGLTIADNLLISNGAGQMQGVFISNNVGTRSLLDRITITGNVMSGTMWNGIAAFQAANLTVTSNKLYSNPTAEAPRTWVRLEEVSTASVRGNLAAGFIYSDVSALSAASNKVQLTNSGAASAIANWDLANSAGSLGVAKGKSTMLAGLRSAVAFDGAQSFAAGVPEPSVWLSMIAGFGLIGAAMRRLPRGRLQPGAARRMARG